MGGANFKQKNLLKDLIYLGQTRPVNKQTIKGLFRFALEPLLEAQTQKALVLTRLLNTEGIEGVLKRLEFTNTEVYSFDSFTTSENLEKNFIWDDTEFLVILSPRYSVVLLWDYSTEKIKDTSCLYYLLNSKEVNNVIHIINQNSKIDLMRYTQEYTPERRGNELLNKAVHKFIDFADSFVEETTMAKAENTILGDNDDIEKKYEYISSKTKTISHDIRNHLSVIDLYSKIMERRLEIVTDAEIKDSMKNAITSIKKSKESIDILLNELRTIQGIDLQTYNFSEILDSVIDLVNAKAHIKNTTIEITNNYDGNILADKNKLLNVMINIVYNALDAIETNGRIDINVIEDENNMLKIEIKNNGAMIPEDVQKRVFEEGYTSKTTGSGLGLFISKEAMKEQYGDLILQKSNEQETVFEITIPKI